MVDKRLQESNVYISKSVWVLRFRFQWAFYPKNMVFAMLHYAKARQLYTCLQYCLCMTMHLDVPVKRQLNRFAKCSPLRRTYTYTHIQWVLGWFFCRPSLSVYELFRICNFICCKWRDQVHAYVSGWYLPNAITGWYVYVRACERKRKCKMILEPM